MSSPSDRRPQQSLGMPVQTPQEVWFQTLPHHNKIKGSHHSSKKEVNCWHESLTCPQCIWSHHAFRLSRPQSQWCVLMANEAASASVIVIVISYLHVNRNKMLEITWDGVEHTRRYRRILATSVKTQGVCQDLLRSGRPSWGWPTIFEIFFRFRLLSARVGARTKILA